MWKSVCFPRKNKRWKIKFQGPGIWKRVTHVQKKRAWQPNWGSIPYPPLRLNLAVTLNIKTPFLKPTPHKVITPPTFLSHPPFSQKRMSPIRNSREKLWFSVSLSKHLQPLAWWRRAGTPPSLSCHSPISPRGLPRFIFPEKDCSITNSHSWKKTSASVSLSLHPPCLIILRKKTSQPHHLSLSPSGPNFPEKDYLSLFLPFEQNLCLFLCVQTPPNLELRE